jgi:hypothetical protein
VWPCGTGSARLDDALENSLQRRTHLLDDMRNAEKAVEFLDPLPKIVRLPAEHLFKMLVIGFRAFEFGHSNPEHPHLLKEWLIVSVDWIHDALPETLWAIEGGIKATRYQVEKEKHDEADALCAGAGRS